MPEVSGIDPARFNMVLQQVRPWGVLDDRVLGVMAEVPRERFVPDAYRSLAYADIEVPLTAERAMLAPKIVGRMLQALQVRPGERALEVGIGSGYVAACLARLGAQILSLEWDVDLAQSARQRLTALAVTGVEIKVADAFAGPIEGGPFDVIAVNGSLPSEARLAVLKAQLADKGRLFAVVGQLPLMRVLRITRVGAMDFRREVLFETCVSALTRVPEPVEFVF